MNFFGIVAEYFVYTKASGPAAGDDANRSCILQCNRQASPVVAGA